MERALGRVGASMLGVALSCGLAKARAESTCQPTIVLDCRLGLRTITRADTYPFTEDDRPTSKLARDEDDFGDLWRFYGLEGRPPAIDHRRFVVFAIVARKGCLSALTCAILIGGSRPKVDPDIPSLEVWIFAYPRERLLERCPVESVVDWSGIRVGHLPWAEELEQIENEASCYRPEFVATRQARHPFWGAVRFQTSLQGVIGIDTSVRPVYGALVAAGFARRTSNREPWYGNEAGLEVRARLLRVEGGFVDSWAVGFRPWLAHSRRWAFDFVNLKRKPSLLGVFIPEGGAFLRENLGVRPYLAWSAPFLWHRREFFYRTTPYLLREHFAVYFEPGVLWVPGEPVLATLSLGVGLW
jgi:hypothetical protein